MRIFVGPGYRLYYTQLGDEIFWLLVGGDMSSHKKDIQLAKEMAAEIHGQS
jgi:putative addiction module killer protein